MALPYILIAAVMVIAVVALVVHLVVDTADDRRRAGDPSMQSGWVDPGPSADAHHSGWGHHGHDSGGGHHGGGDSGGGHHG